MSGIMLSEATTQKLLYRDQVPPPPVTWDSLLQPVLSKAITSFCYTVLLIRHLFKCDLVELILLLSKPTHNFSLAQKFWTAYNMEGIHSKQIYISDSLVLFYSSNRKLLRSAIVSTGAKVILNFHLHRGRNLRSTWQFYINSISEINFCTPAKAKFVFLLLVTTQHTSLPCWWSPDTRTPQRQTTFSSAEWSVISSRWTFLLKFPFLLYNTAIPRIPAE